VCAGRYDSRSMTALPSFSLALAKLRGPSNPLLRATHESGGYTSLPSSAKPNLFN
jgi:hypothetical protein